MFNDKPIKVRRKCSSNDPKFNLELSISVISPGTKQKQDWRVVLIIIQYGIFISTNPVWSTHSLPISSSWDQSCIFHFLFLPSPSEIFFSFAEPQNFSINLLLQNEDQLLIFYETDEYLSPLWQDKIKMNVYGTIISNFGDDSKTDVGKSWLEMSKTRKRDFPFQDWHEAMVFTY